MDFSCSSDGSSMCTSGSRQRGSCIPSTWTADSTRIGMSCVIVVSRCIAPPKLYEYLSTASSPSFTAPFPSSKTPGTLEKERLSKPARPELVAWVFVSMVRERRGLESFLVRRIEAEEADWAERSARWRDARGTSRLIVLLGAADWME